MKPLCIDLFCGYGGWARGFSRTGYRIIGFDNEIKCAKHYKANGGEFPGFIAPLERKHCGGKDSRNQRINALVPESLALAIAEACLL